MTTLKPSATPPLTAALPTARLPVFILLSWVQKKAACVCVLVCMYYIGSLEEWLMDLKTCLCPVGAVYMNGSVCFFFGGGGDGGPTRLSTPEWNALLPDTPCQPAGLMEPSCGGQAQTPGSPLICSQRLLCQMG